ncbi:hypothetical protein PO909_023145 [Leuciscus waleckii]
MSKELLGKYKTHKKPVLLLLDNKHNKPLRHLLKNLQSKPLHDQTDGPALIIINAVRKSVREKSHVKLKLELLPEEKERFAEKRLEIEEKHKKMSNTFHAFNIMQGGFQKEKAEKMITGEMANLIEKDKTSSSTKLLSFLALINSYVPGSHLSKPLCKKFIEQSEWPTNKGKPSVEDIMKPFMDLIVVFSDGKEKANCIRLKHPMIADACLKRFKENNLTRSDITLDFLNKMVKGNQSDYMKICKRLLFIRPEGLVEKEKFSRLNLDIMREGTTNKCIELLERASNLFPTDPFYPQALARLYYIKVDKKNPKKSHIRDTMGQVHKNNLSRIWILREWTKVKKPCTDINTRLKIARFAIKAFEEEEKAAEDELDDDTKFNNREIYDLISPRNHLEQRYHDFINGLRGKVESKCDFFERYLTFSSLSNKTEEPEYFHETQTILYILANIILSQAGEPAVRGEELQDMLQKLWSTKAEGRSPEFYLLILLLFWPEEAKPNPPNLGDCVQNMSQSYGRTYQKHLHGRFLVPLFFYGKGEGLQRLVHALKPHQNGSQRLVLSELHQTDLELLTEGYESVEVACLQRIDGIVKNHRVFAVRNGQQIEVNAYKQANACKQGHMSFYLGFTIGGPVAYNITYQNCKYMLYISDS